MWQAFLHFDFLKYAFYTGLMIGFLAPFFGVFLVVRRMTLIADALSHITLTGIAFSLLLSKQMSLFSALNPMYMGMTFSVVGSLLIEKLRKVYKYYKELAIPVMLSSGIGLGVVFISLADGFNQDLFQYLFGSIVTITKEDFSIIGLITIISLIFIILFYKEWFFISFDEEHAIVSGLPKKSLDFCFSIIVAFVIAASMQIVGILLVSSLMTLPVAAAMRLAKGFKQMFFYSVLFGEISVIFGLAAAFQFDVAPGGTIVLMNIFILIIVIFFTRKKVA